MGAIDWSVLDHDDDDDVDDDNDDAGFYSFLALIWPG